MSDTDPLPPAAGSAADGDDNANEHADPDWEIFTCCPAIASAADRAVVPSFGSIAYETLPCPFPLAPEITRIQDALLAAVQGHPAGALTFTTAVDAADGKDAAAAERLYTQVGPLLEGVNGVRATLIG